MNESANNPEEVYFGVTRRLNSLLDYEVLEDAWEATRFLHETKQAIEHEMCRRGHCPRYNQPLYHRILRRIVEKLGQA